jgi:alkylated DNA repair protein (DNA oxidative demethylase)
VQPIATDLTLLRSFVATAPLRARIAEIAARSPFRHLRTRGGLMSVAMTNCGTWGWHSDASGYRYVASDPQSGAPWPSMPPEFCALAAPAALAAGYDQFRPDCCLVNRYAVGARMGTHRDFDEIDMSHPIVSVSIGLPATFLWYGPSRGGKPLRIELHDGDVLVWGGSARAGFHAVGPVGSPEAEAQAAGALRFNLTFRRAK